MFFAYEENDIIEKVENTYYSMVVLDLRMDSYNIDGIKIAQKIIDTNPFAKIVLMSAFKAEYLVSLKEIILSLNSLEDISSKPTLIRAECLQFLNTSSRKTPFFLD